MELIYFTRYTIKTGEEPVSTRIIYIPREHVAVSKDSTGKYVDISSPVILEEGHRIATGQEIQSHEAGIFNISRVQMPEIDAEKLFEKLEAIIERNSTLH